jgi:hypothetical protein
MKTRSVLHFKTLIVLLTILSLFLAGCGSSSPTPSVLPTQALAGPVLSSVNLPDGSLIVLNGKSAISINALDGLGATPPHDTALIKGGELLAVSSLPSGTWFTVNNTRSAIAHVMPDGKTPGAIMLVTFDATSGIFTVDCIRGICELGPDAGHLTTIPVGSQLVLDQNGNVQGPTAFDSVAINSVYGGFIQDGLAAPTAVLATSTPTLTTTPTPNLPATATAVCHTFHSLHPATPCP